MPSRLDLPNTALLRYLALVVCCEEPLILFCISGTEVGRLIVVRCMVVVEQFECRKSSSCRMLSRLNPVNNQILTRQRVHLGSSLYEILD